MSLSHLCDALLVSLSQACQNKSISPKPERKLHNIFNNMEAWLPMDISKQPKPAIPAAYMPPLSPDRMQEIVEPYMASVWSELDANWTQALISRCGTIFLCHMSTCSAEQMSLSDNVTPAVRPHIETSTTVNNLTMAALKVAGSCST